MSQPSSGLQRSTQHSDFEPGQKLYADYLNKNSYTTLYKASHINLSCSPHGKREKIMNIKDYPFAQRLITDSQGHIVKEIINYQDYERIIEAIEDEGLYRAMRDVKEETPLSLEEALAELDKQRV